MKIGIPRALSAYTYYPLWKTFLETLGMEVQPSEPTGKAILDMGVKTCVDDACLPVKIFHGHALSLNKSVDYIVIPQIMSVQKKEYSCPMICGLPEMVKYSLLLDTPVMELKINMYNGTDMAQDMAAFGLRFTKNRRSINKAYDAALEVYNQQERRMLAGSFPDWTGLKTANTFGKMSIGMLGHPYILYDPFLSSLVINYFIQAGFHIYTPETIKDETAGKNAALLPKKMFWSSGKHLYGSALQMVKNRLDGIVYISSFGCGVDSIIADLAERAIRKSNIPFLLLTLDEHTGEAGLKTRVEAFCDMLLRRNNRGCNVPAYGQYLHRAQSIL